MSDHTTFEFQEVDSVTGQPYEQWQRAREGCPVIQTSDSLMGMGRTLSQITRREDVERVLRDPKTFSSSINGEFMEPYMGELILAMDGTEHRSYRNLVAHAFRASQLKKWDDIVVRPTIGMYLDAIAPLGKADLVRALRRSTRYASSVQSSASHSKTANSSMNGPSRSTADRYTQKSGLRQPPPCGPI